MKNFLTLLLVLLSFNLNLLAQDSPNDLGNSTLTSEDASCDGKLKISAFGSNCLRQLGINAQDLVAAGNYDLSLMSSFSSNRYYGTNTSRLGIGYQMTEALGLFVGTSTRTLTNSPFYGSSDSRRSTPSWGRFGSRFVWSTTITGEITPFAAFFEGPIWQQIVIDYNITTDFADRPEISGIGSINFEMPFRSFGRNFRGWFGAWSLLFDNFPDFVRNQGNVFRFNSDFGLTAGISFCL